MVTNLFYWNNIVHDVTHGYGFDEAAGNFQVNNYGNGGVGNDDVRAEAQDGSGKNNANFGTGVEGVRPRMQMFEWRSSVPNPVTVAAPSPIAGTYFGPMAGFGESLVTTGPITGTALLVNDGAGISPTDGCEPFAVPAGGIPLIDRGNCNFTVKVKNAQNAGAATAIVLNNIAGPATGMGGADPTITIPSVMVSQDDGNLFKANLPFTVTLADGTGGAPDRDSDLDAGVIAHEYGHGISNRLTGGPATVSCLNNAEQMGEGWSDWFALNFTTHPDDRPHTARGVGSYVIFEPPDGPGIRPTPYTTDMNVNQSTYAFVADVVNISQPHGIGYVWNTMLWEVYWKLVDRYGYNADIYGDWTTGGNNLALQLVMDGLKFQPCRAGLRRRPERDPAGRHGPDRRRQPVRDLARVRQARAGLQRQPGQLEQPHRWRGGLRSPRELHRRRLPRLQATRPGTTGRQHGQRGLDRAREVPCGRAGHHADHRRPPAGRLHHARPHRRSAAIAGHTRKQRDLHQGRPLPHQLEDQGRVGGDLPEIHHPDPRRAGRRRLLQLLLGGGRRP